MVSPAALSLITTVVLAPLGRQRKLKRAAWIAKHMSAKDTRRMVERWQCVLATRACPTFKTSVSMVLSDGPQRIL